MCANSVVKVLIAWDGRSALRKVRLTQLLRDGGVRLRDAAQYTAWLLNGTTVDTVLPAYGNPEAVADAFREIGVDVQSSAPAEPPVAKWDVGKYDSAKWG
jgi:hypothetical protein